MPDAPWRSLVSELMDAGYQSPYLDRLRRRVDITQSRDSLEKEIIREMAAALGRAEDKLNAALLRLELAERALRDASGSDDRRRRIDEFNLHRAAALHARWELVIQRESVGIRRNEILETLYPIPPRASLDR
jgi:hypothetical protein